MHKMYWVILNVWNKYHERTAFSALSGGVWEYRKLYPQTQFNFKHNIPRFPLTKYVYSNSINHISRWQANKYVWSKFRGTRRPLIKGICSNKSHLQDHRAIITCPSGHHDLAIIFLTGKFPDRASSSLHDPDNKVHGANMGPTGPRWVPCWSHEPCYLASFPNFHWSDWTSIPVYQYCSGLTFIWVVPMMAFSWSNDIKVVCDDVMTWKCLYITGPF